MPDREKVIKGLECHRIDNNHRINCADCPYYVDDDSHILCVNDLHDDALAILQEQEADMIALKNAYKELAEKGSVIVRCKDCDNRECDGRAGTIVCGITGESHSRLWFCADGERK